MEFQRKEKKTIASQHVHINTDVNNNKVVWKIFIQFALMNSKIYASSLPLPRKENVAIAQCFSFAGEIVC